MELPNRKLIERVKKLLALAADSGATEAEAALAAERARAMMAEHGITMAQAEAAGETSEPRVRDGQSGFMSKPWQRSIMRALCEQSFVFADFVHAKPGEKTGSWRLWGRESAVTVVKLMHQYLVKTVHRTVREQTGGATDEIFKEAMGERIADRILQRHHAAMREQAAAAREKQAAARHPSSAGNALVIVLEDYAQRERDLNEDLRLGFRPGTTAQKRADELLERQRREQAKAEKRAALLADGLTEDVVEIMLWGYSQEEAEKICADGNKARTETEEQRERRRARERREDEKWRERFARQQERNRQRHNHPSARAGRAAGDQVGLDQQVEHRETRKLGGN